MLNDFIDKINLDLLYWASQHLLFWAVYMLFFSVGFYCYLILWPTEKKLVEAHEKEQARLKSRLADLQMPNPYRNETSSSIK